MAEMQVHVVSATRELYRGEASAVYARSTEGEIGILPGHQPVLLALEISPVRVEQTDGEVITWAVHAGFLEYREEKLTVLADHAEGPGEIDVERARAARHRAELHLADPDYEGDAAAELRRAHIRLELAGAS
ncbi:MAG TPA: F0F1 ATP synthase subunit epsilon [Euzebyales bacterium]|nr:F0F1 ATP synthase subunit epsilon [Euzebyales bacterium]